MVAPVHYVVEPLFAVRVCPPPTFVNNNLCVYITLPIYLTKYQDTLVEKRKRNRKLLLTIPRTATASWIRKISFLVRQIKGVGLEFAINVDRLAASGVLVAVLTGKTAGVDIDAFLALGLPETFTLVTDQEQLQVTGGAFMEDELKITMVRLYDWFHREHNNNVDAIAKSGFQVIFLACIAIFNVSYGPYKDCQWFWQLLHMAADLVKTMGPDDPLLIKFWPKILKDKGLAFETADEIIGRPGRVKFLQALSAVKVLELKSVKVKPSQWQSFPQAAKAWDPEIHTRAMILAGLCLHKGWIVAVEDLFLPFRKSTPLVAADVANNSKASSVASAKATLDALKQRSVNNLHACTQLICDPDIITGFRLLHLGGRAVHENFTSKIEKLKGPTSTLEFIHAQSQMAWLEVCKDTFRTRGDMTALGRCGLVVDFPASRVTGVSLDSPAVRADDALAGGFGRYTHQLVSNMIGSSMLYSEEYPCKFGGLLQECTSQSTLKEIEMDLRSFWKAKESHYSYLFYAFSCIIKTIIFMPIFMFLEQFTTSFWRGRL
jgi:hypothetical protein